MSEIRNFQAQADTLEGCHLSYFLALDEAPSSNTGDLTQLFLQAESYFPQRVI